MARKLEGTSNNNIHVIIIKKFITCKYLYRYNQMCEQNWKKNASSKHKSISRRTSRSRRDLRWISIVTSSNFHVRTYMNIIETTYGRSHVNVKVEPHPTFTFTPGFLTLPLFHLCEGTQSGNAPLKGEWWTVLPAAFVYCQDVKLVFQLCNLCSLNLLACTGKSSLN